MVRGQDGPTPRIHTPMIQAHYNQIRFTNSKSPNLLHKLKTLKNYSFIMPTTDVHSILGIHRDFKT